jgi:hypothetical protein
MVTLTSPAAKDVHARFDRDSLRDQVLKVRCAFPKFWRKTPWGRQVPSDGNTRRNRARRDTSYIFAQEISPSGMVHVHALVYGEFVAQRDLQASWSKALGEDAIVHVRAARGPNGVGKALREVLKYATKGEKGARVQPLRAAAVELAFRNVHRVSLGGSVRKVHVSDSTAATEDVKASDLHDERQMACEGCGVVGGRWIWRGTVGREVVARNGRFGLMTVVVPAAELTYAGPSP